MYKVAIIISTYVTDDRGFEYRQGVCIVFRTSDSAMLFFVLNSRSCCV
jgi:hypothetical protein